MISIWNFSYSPIDGGIVYSAECSDGEFVIYNKMLLVKTLADIHHYAIDRFDGIDPQTSSEAYKLLNKAAHQLQGISHRNLLRDDSKESYLVQRAYFVDGTLKVQFYEGTGEDIQRLCFYLQESHDVISDFMDIGQWGIWVNTDTGKELPAELYEALPERSPYALEGSVEAYLKEYDETRFVNPSFPKNEGYLQEVFNAYPVHWVGSLSLYRKDSTFIDCEDHSAEIHKALLDISLPPISQLSAEIEEWVTL